MLLDLGEVAFDCEIGSCFLLLRQTGSFTSGGWTPGPVTTINAFGIVTIATPKELEMVPEGDRVKGSLHIIYGQQLYVTRADGQKSGTSDQIKWCGELYRLAGVEPWSMIGFWHGIAVRLKGN